jgi:RND family efflux transporter MFP subunit
MNSPTKSRKALSIIFRIVLPLAIIAAGAAIAWHYKANKPVVQRKPPVQQKTLVETVLARPSLARVVVSGMGTVVPARETVLRPQVNGNVVFMSEGFTPGGIVQKGDELMRIDPDDYRIALEKRQSELQKAKADLALEQGRQEIARREIDLLRQASPEDVSGTELALRKPQLEQALADVALAEADLAQARLDLERTIIYAPFNALVLERNVNLGALVGLDYALTTLVGTDEYWIEATVPLDSLKFLDMTLQGASATVHSQLGGESWTGRVLRITGTLDENSRMASILVAVDNPLTSGTVPLMLNDYVKVDIQGRELDDVYELPRSALRRGETVWVSNGHALDIRNVDIVWRDGERVFVKAGLAPGEQVVLSDIAAPVKGMPLELAGTENPEEEAVTARQQQPAKNQGGRNDG